ncbi:hypothetical protein BESB_045130 [Besnoitia besnoiti]|uniref:Uncharacterized protein n=1 Tax=Besnoitia besnoiti TaxID=94643 RepID=A0A2A9MJ92_BESBE|nr:hypothetical protein BESB_045130 [Besnoitia besnoiti]PFH36321.1 hypothetical protein BESB_045130 [Besnoitia besnoiti]
MAQSPRDFTASAPGDKFQYADEKTDAHSDTGRDESFSSHEMAALAPTESRRREPGVDAGERKREAVDTEREDLQGYALARSEFMSAVPLVNPETPQHYKGTNKVRGRLSSGTGGDPRAKRLPKALATGRAGVRLLSAVAVTAVSVVLARYAFLCVLRVPSSLLSADQNASVSVRRLAAGSGWGQPPASPPTCDNAAQGGSGPPPPPREWPAGHNPPHPVPRDVPAAQQEASEFESGELGTVEGDAVELEEIANTLSAVVGRLSVSRGHMRHGLNALFTTLSSVIPLVDNLRNAAAEVRRQKDSSSGAASSLEEKLSADAGLPPGAASASADAAEEQGVGSQSKSPAGTHFPQTHPEGSRHAADSAGISPVPRESSKPDVQQGSLTGKHGGAAGQEDALLSTGVASVEFLFGSDAEPAKAHEAPTRLPRLPPGTLETGAQSQLSTDPPGAAGPLSSDELGLRFLDPTSPPGPEHMPLSPAYEGSGLSSHSLWGSRTLLELIWGRPHSAPSDSPKRTEAETGSLVSWAHRVRHGAPKKPPAPSAAPSAPPAQPPRQSGASSQPEPQKSRDLGARPKTHMQQSPSTQGSGRAGASRGGSRGSSGKHAAGGKDHAAGSAAGGSSSSGSGSGGSRQTQAAGAGGSGSPPPPGGRKGDGGWSQRGGAEGGAKDDDEGDQKGQKRDKKSKKAKSGRDEPGLGAGRRGPPGGDDDPAAGGAAGSVGGSAGGSAEPTVSQEGAAGGGEDGSRAGRGVGGREASGAKETAAVGEEAQTGDAGEGDAPAAPLTAKQRRALARQSLQAGTKAAGDSAASDRPQETSASGQISSEASGGLEPVLQEIEALEAKVVKHLETLVEALMEKATTRNLLLALENNDDEDIGLDEETMQGLEEIEVTTSEIWQACSHFSELVDEANKKVVEAVVKQHSKSKKRKAKRGEHPAGSFSEEDVLKLGPYMERAKKMKDRARKWIGKMAGFRLRSQVKRMVPHCQPFELPGSEQSEGSPSRQETREATLERMMTWYSETVTQLRALVRQDAANVENPERRAQMEETGHHAARLVAVSAIRSLGQSLLTQWRQDSTASNAAAIQGLNDLLNGFSDGVDLYRNLFIFTYEVFLATFHKDAPFRTNAPFLSPEEQRAHQQAIFRAAVFEKS